MPCPWDHLAFGGCPESQRPLSFAGRADAPLRSAPPMHLMMLVACVSSEYAQSTLPRLIYVAMARIRPRSLGGLRSGHQRVAQRQTQPSSATLACLLDTSRTKQALYCSELPGRGRWAAPRACCPLQNVWRPSRATPMPAMRVGAAEASGSPSGGPYCCSAPPGGLPRCGYRPLEACLLGDSGDC